MEGSNPSGSDLPSYQPKRDEVAAQRVPPGEGEVAPASESGSATEAPAPAGVHPAPPEPPTIFTSSVPIAPPPEYPVAGEPAAAAASTSATSQNNLPGDASMVENPTPKAVIYRSQPPESPAPPGPRVVKIPSPRSRRFTCLAVLWLILWTASLFLTLYHPFDRKGDWDTALWSVAARNIGRDGFGTTHGGVYISAGERFQIEKRQFYAGRPPMTAWMLAGWMKALKIDQPGSAVAPEASKGKSCPLGIRCEYRTEAMIRALPLAFTALNLLLLFLLVKRAFGSGAALAAMMACSMLPMTAFYAQSVNSHVFEMTFLLGAAHGYLSWVKCRSRFALLVLFACVVLGCWTDWVMYLFAGFLAIAHFFQKREMVAVSAEEMAADPNVPAERLSRRPLLVSLALVVVPLAVFAVFLIYLKSNGHGFADVLKHGQDNWTVAVPPAAQAAAPATQAAAAVVPAAAQPAATQAVQVPAYKHAKDRISDWSRARSLFHGLRERFLSAFTIPALTLAVLGGLFWRRWSRRLTVDGDCGRRRAAFRVLFCLFLMQAAYSLVFMRGAWKWEHWQYYLIVPMGALIGGFCVWLTISGAEPRRFSAGLFDRAAWAVFALIGVMAIGPLAWGLQIRLPFRPVIRGGTDLNFELRQPLAELTKPGDVILTDMTMSDLKTALPWYADRYIIASDASEHSTLVEPGITALVKEYEAGNARQIFYVLTPWNEKTTVDYVNRMYPRRIKIANTDITLHEIRATQPWPPAGAKVVPATLPALPPAIVPAPATRATTVTPPVVSPPPVVVTPPTVITAPATRPVVVTPPATRPATAPATRGTR